MVAIASRPQLGVARRWRNLGWSVAAGAALILGLSVRLVPGGGGVGDRSAAVMATLLCLGLWLAALLLGTPRTGLFVTIGVVALLDFGALPTRDGPQYDDREALYRPDQTLITRVSVAPGLADKQPMLTVLAEPSFPAAEAQPSFGLAGDVNATAATWDCRFRRGIQRLALPVPPSALGTASSVADVRLHLNGWPSRDSEYLLVYTSAKQGGPLVSLVDASDAGPATTCALR